MDKTIDDVIKEIEQLALENSSQSIWVEINSINDGDAEKMKVEIVLSEPDEPGDWACYGKIKENFPVTERLTEQCIEMVLERLADDRDDELTTEDLLEDIYSRKPKLFTEEEIEQIRQDVKSEILENIDIDSHIFYLPLYIKENLNKLQIIHK